MAINVPLIPIIIGSVVLLAVLLIYYYFFEVPNKKSRKLLNRLHFMRGVFQKAMRVATFEKYDEKVTRLVLVLFGVFFGVFIPSIFMIPPPYNIFTSIAGLIIAASVSYNFRSTLNLREQERNTNKPFGPSFTNYPGEGDIDEMWRRMEIEEEVQLSSKQKENLVDQIIDGIKGLPSFDKKKYPAKKLMALKKMWVQRLSKFKVYRMKVMDDFRILYVTPHKFKESVTEGTRPILDETQWVNVNIAPQFTLYCDTTRKIFASTDDKGRPEWDEITMGVYLNIYDIKSRDEDLMTGDHVVLTKTDVLLAEFLHLYDQRQSSGKQMTKALRDLEKSNLINDENVIDAHAEANAIAKDLGKMLRDLNTAGKQERSKADWAAIGIGIGAISAISFIVGMLFEYFYLLAMAGR